MEHYLTEESIRNGEEFSSWLGMDFLVKITKPGAGMVCKNIVVTTTHSDFVSIKFIFTINNHFTLLLCQLFFKGVNLNTSPEMNYSIHFILLIRQFLVFDVVCKPIANKS